MRGPDLAYVSQSKVAAHPNPERLFRCVPDLAIEIDLTSGKKPGGQQRIVDFLEAGVPLIWATRALVVARRLATSLQPSMALPP